MTPTAQIVPAYTQMLTALSGWLARAQAQMPGAAGEALLSARLAPDMFPLATQVRFVCIQAHEPPFRLKGAAMPELLNELGLEGRNAGEHPGTIAEARARIDEALAALAALPADAFDGDAQRPVALELPNGIAFDMTGEQYLRDWAQPQFYFHLMAAYAILRNNGVDLGKADYVPHMFGYLRPAVADA